MNSNEYWGPFYRNLDINELRYDNWLDKYESELKQFKNCPIIDLGCGIGNNTLYLKERGYKVISCDFSDEALLRLKSFVPDCEIMQFDMTEGLPFDDHYAGVVIADLSLHYFSEEVTFEILKQIKRVLKVGGLLLSRVNSTGDVNFGARGLDNGNYYYPVNGQYKRFFNESHIKHFFKMFIIQYTDEYELKRYSKGKIAWEIAVRTKKG